MKLSQNQQKELKERLRPLFDRWYDHSYRWPSLSDANEFTSELLEILDEYGVKIFG